MSSDSDSSTQTPPPPFLSTNLYACMSSGSHASQPSTSRHAEDRLSSSSPERETFDPQVYYNERIPCWCRDCQGTSRRARRICHDHIQRVGLCPHAPPQQFREQAPVITSH